ncbi:putative leucine-rich repeat domain superfamily [Helianthus anomalus]
MGEGSRKQPSYITSLPDEQLHLIFEKLDSNLDQESFGLTCHCFLNIQDSSCKFLYLQHIRYLNDSNSHPIRVESFMLHRLLNRLKQLESLSVAGIFGCPSLSVIILCSTSIEDSGLGILRKSCNSLKKLDLGGCKNITDSGIQSIIQNCRQLRTLRITCCEKINGIGFKGCSSTLASLEANGYLLDSLYEKNTMSYSLLDFDLVPITYKGVWFIIIKEGKKAPSLISLRASKVGTALVAANLKTLNLWECNYVTDDGIISISKGCPLLQDLNLESCENITISGWESIGLYCQNLKRIHVAKCLKLCDRGLLLANGCKHLSFICIYCWKFYK